MVFGCAATFKRDVYANGGFFFRFRFPVSLFVSVGWRESCRIQTFALVLGCGRAKRSPARSSGLKEAAGNKTGEKAEKQKLG